MSKNQGYRIVNILSEGESLESQDTHYRELLR